MKKNALPRKLTCEDPEQFFWDCPGCKLYGGCDFFNKVKLKKKRPHQPQEVK